MTFAKTLLSSAALAAALVGCRGTTNRGLESVHQPVVERADYALELQTAGGALASGEQARLHGWFEAMRLGYGDRVTVEDPDGRASGARAEIGGAVAAYGLLIDDRESPIAAPVQPGTVRVVVARMRASVPGCPDFSRNSSMEYEAQTSSNYGCATNGNLAAMVADPSDLVRGRTGSTSTDPAASGKAIDAYRKAAPSGAKSAK